MDKKRQIQGEQSDTRAYDSMAKSLPGKQKHGPSDGRQLQPKMAHRMLSGFPNILRVALVAVGYTWEGGG